MRIIITTANDVSLNDASELMETLRKDVLEQEKYKHIIKDVQVTQ